MVIDCRSERAFGVCRVGRDCFYPGEVRIAHNSPPGLCAARHPGESFWSRSGSADWPAAAAESRKLTADSDVFNCQTASSSGIPDGVRVNIYYRVADFNKNFWPPGER